MSRSITHESRPRARYGVHGPGAANLSKGARTVGHYAAVPARAVAVQEALINGIPDDLRSHFRLRKPRLCAACLVESGHSEEAWRHIPFTHCPAHGNQLAQRCLYCSAPFDADCFRQDRCLECGRSWRWMAKASADTMPEHQAHILEASPEDYQNYLAGLKLALAAIVRPFDTAQRIRRHLPSSDDYSTLLPLAHELLSSDTFLLAYKESLSQKRARYRKLGRYAVYLNFDNLVQDLRALRATTTLATPQNIRWPDHFPLCQEFIAPVRLKVVENSWDPDEALMAQANLSDACKILGVKSDVCLGMMRAGMIFNFSPDSMTRIFDTNDLLMASNKIRPSFSSTLWTLQEAVLYCRKYGIRPDKLQMMALKGEIPVVLYPERINLFDKILFDAPAVIRTAARFWRNQGQTSIASYDVAKILFVNEREIDECVRAGHLETDENMGMKPRIKTISMDLLSKHFFFPVRYATLRRKKASEVLWRLRKMGFKPVFGHSIFSRSPEVVSATKEILSSEQPARDRRRMKLG